MKFLANLDINLNQLLKAVVENVASDPVANLSDGRIIYNSSDRLFKIYKQSAWHVIGLINDSSTSTIDTLSANKIISLIDAAKAGLLSFQGGYNASTNVPDLDTSPSGIKKGYAYVVTAAGTFFTEPLQIGDMVIAQQDNPTTLAHWTTVNKNIPDIVSASETAEGIIELATQAEVNSGIDVTRAVTSATLHTKMKLSSGLSPARVFIVKIGNGSATSFSIKHGLTSEVVCQVYDESTGEYVYCDMRRDDGNNITLSFAIAPTTDQFKVVIIG